MMVEHHLDFTPETSDAERTDLMLHDNDPGL